MNCPSTIPMRTEPVGPSHGISEIASATEDPIIAAISEGAIIVYGHDCRNDLHVIEETLREQRSEAVCPSVWN